MHVFVASCVASQTIFGKMSGRVHNGKVAEVKPLIDSFLFAASVPPRLGLAWSAVCKEVLESA